MDHRYVSTACLHGLHDYCRSPVKADGSPKDNGPARCKFCSAPCECTGCDHGGSPTTAERTSQPAS